MSKRDKNKKKKKRRSGSPYSSHNFSGLGDHKQSGTKLIPPFGQIPKMSMSSWADDHMPEMLWAALLAATLDRQDFLKILRQLAVVARAWFVSAPGQVESAPNNTGDQMGINFTVVADHTKLAEVDEQSFQAFVDVPLQHPLGYAALRPLLLLGSLPGVDRWRNAINAEPQQSDWKTLARAVAVTLDHQSEESTDVRWFKYIVPIISGRMQFPESMAEHLEEIRLYPDKGDLRSVRPRIRAGEMTIRRHPPGAWISAFWTQLLSHSPCIDPSDGGEYKFSEPALDPTSLYETREGVISKFFSEMTATRGDARLDSAFGLVLYALSILEEIGLHQVQNRIAGRLQLRSLVEVSITFRYLAKSDKAELWTSYRVYGAGQAKLAFLKAQEAQQELPRFVDEKVLHAIANEDAWQEFLNIDVGHWANSNLRKLAIESGSKEL